MNDATRAFELLCGENIRFAAARGEETITSQETGLRFLLGRKSAGESLEGFAVADKIIGKAAALLLIGMKIASLYAETISRPALALLHESNIPCTYGTITDFIVNRVGDGLCPMEETVLTISDPEEAAAALLQTARRLREQGMSPAKLRLTGKTLVPDSVNTSPDYYCTWQTQLYVCNNTGPQGQRDNLNEQLLFEDSFPGGWANFHPDARRDLILVMDDSWDVPVGEAPNPGPHYGTLELDAGKFSTFAGENVENRDAMKHLNEAIQAKGWRGIGGWICAQNAPIYADVPEEEYWSARYRESDYAGWKYWKIDWGSRCNDPAFRRMLSEKRKELASNLVAEQAMCKELIPEIDVFRTYDVPALMSIPMTMQKLSETLCFDANPGAGALVDCEDEVYLAAALGCSMGVMRHPMAGNLPNGQPDPSFPALHRNLKTKMDEVTRAVRWHRIAPAFAVNGSQTNIDPELLTDRWQIEEQPREIEAWWKFRSGDQIEKSGPARISRGLPLPEVTPDSNGNVPYVAAAKHPNGAVSIVTLGRTCEREWILPECNVSLEAGDAFLFGIFGVYGTLELHSSAAQTGRRILAQDPLSEQALDVSALVTCENGILTVPGKLIASLGTMCNHPGDTSEPGLFLKIEE